MNPAAPRINPVNNTFHLDMDLNRVTIEYEYAFHFLGGMNSKTLPMIKNEYVENYESDIDRLMQ